MNCWNSTGPIYVQLGEHLIRDMLGRGLRAGASLPSIRELSRTYMVNPLTVQRALDDLRDKGCTELRDDLGYVLSAAVLDLVQEVEREQFLREEWPALRRRLSHIGITASDLH